jgi:predicted dehydrogenase
VKPVPEGFNWDMWLGPAPWTDYVTERTHGTFRHWLEYSGGMMTDWGAHHNDIAQWGLGMDASGPVTIEGHGVPAQPSGKDCYNAFPQFRVVYTYANGVPLHCGSEGENGVLFEGERGWIFVNRGRIGASDEKLLSEPLPASATRLYVSNDHMGNFVDCVRSRKDTICTAEIGHRSVSVCHLGNISMRLSGRKLYWDPQKERFANDREANEMLKRPARNGWSV